MENALKLLIINYLAQKDRVYRKMVAITATILISLPGAHGVAFKTTGVFCQIGFIVDVFPEKEKFTHIPV